MNIKKHKMKTYSIYILMACLISSLSFSQEAIRVKTQGNGQPILLLPGFANSSEVWEETVENIEGKYQFHLVDYAGFNGLEPVSTPWLPKVQHALIEYVKANDLKNLTIVGHSLGGTLALYLAAELQNHIKEIILVDALPNTSKLMFPNQEAGSFSYDNPYAKSQLEMPNEGFEQMIAQQLNMMCKNKDKHPLIKEWFIKSDRTTYVYGYIDYLNFNATPYLKNITSKVNIFSATNFGKERSQQVYETQYETLESYTLLFAENAAHYIMFDQPDWFYTEINKILANG